MILRNYDNIMLAIRIPVANYNTNLSTDTTTFGDGHINAKLSNGTLVPIYPRNSSTQYVPFDYFNETSNIDTIGWASYFNNLICGSGDTPVTYDDYKLASIINQSQLAVVSGTHTATTPVYNEVDGSWSVTYTRLFKNNTSETLTIREIGVMSPFRNSSSTNALAGALTFRKVLENAIDVHANGLVELSFTTTIYANPNKPANYDATASVN